MLKHARYTDIFASCTNTLVKPNPRLESHLRGTQFPLPASVSFPSLSLTIRRSLVTFAMMLAAAIQYSKPSPPITHLLSISLSPGGVKLPSTNTNGFVPVLLLIFLRVLLFLSFFVLLLLACDALEQTSSTQFWADKTKRDQAETNGRGTAVIGVVNDKRDAGDTWCQGARDEGASALGGL